MQWASEFQYVMEQTGDKNRQIYQLEGVILILDQILLSNLQTYGSLKGELLIRFGS